MNITIKPVSIIKFVTSLIVGVGTKLIVGSIIENNTPEPDTRTRKVTTGAASAVIGMMAAERTKNWTDAKIDAIVDSWSAAAEPAEETQEDPK